MQGYARPIRSCENRLDETLDSPDPGSRSVDVRVVAGVVPRSLAMTAAADRHLLFGLLALQNGIINQVQLVAAFQAWTLDKFRSLAEHLEARGDLTRAKRELLEALAEVHLEAHC